jgi:thiol-disulfide isomerase/thioredoxin
MLSLSLTANAANLGDKAPELQIAKWIKGSPVSLAAGKGSNVFVVEFWATWCPPCRKSIPHLTQLQKKFKDKGVIFVGISTEDEATVRPFVDKLGTNMDYVVAVDKDERTSNGFMKAFKVEGIPHAFVVDKAGNIVWQGHPMTDLESALEDLVAGKLDLNKAKADAEKDRKRVEVQDMLGKLNALVMNDADESKIEALAKEIEAMDKELGGIKQGQPFKADEILKIVRFQKKLAEYQQVLGGVKTNVNIAQLEKDLEATAPEGFTLVEFKEGFQSGRLFDEYVATVGSKPDAAKAAQLAAKLEAVKNPQHLSLFALAILTHESIKDRDLVLATRLAKAGVDASGGKDSIAYVAYAKALFDSGKQEEAIAQQMKAISVCTNAAMKEQLQEQLEAFQTKPPGKPQAK